MAVPTREHNMCDHVCACACVGASKAHCVVHALDYTVEIMIFNLYIQCQSNGIFDFLKRERVHSLLTFAGSDDTNAASGNLTQSLGKS